MQLCEGDWKIDRKYGQQFVVQSYEEVMPANETDYTHLKPELINNHLDMDNDVDDDFDLF